MPKIGMLAESTAATAPTGLEGAVESQTRSKELLDATAGSTASQGLTRT